jgi:hypothetical protein
MSGPLDYLLIAFGVMLDIGVVVCSLRRQELLRFFPLNLYVLLVGVADVGGYLFLRHFGATSRQYFFWYYGSDVLLGVSLYFVIIHLYQLTLASFKIGKYIVGGASLLFVVICALSYRAAHTGTSFLNAHFAVELEQNLNFAGVVLTYLLLGAVLKMRETGTLLVQLVLALGIYFSAIAATYAARVLFPQLDVHSLWRWAPPLISLWLPLAWSYAFLRIPTAARIMTRQVALSPQ